MALPTTTPKPATTPPAAAKPQPKWPEITFRGEAVPSVIPSDIAHLILVSGFYGTGKTTFALGTDKPENILFIDLESKGDGLARQLGVENYFAPAQDAMDAIGFSAPDYMIFDRIRAILEAVPEGRFTTLVIDGLTFLQQAMLEKVKLSPSTYNIRPENAAQGSMGGAWPGVGILLRSLTNLARVKKFKVVVMTTEIKSSWGQSGPILGKFEVKGQSEIHKMSILTVLMVPGPAANLGAPSALVLKEALGKAEWVDGKLVVKKRIPPKLPVASMATVYQYLEQPADYSNLKPEETPSEEEMAPFTKTITKDQLGAMALYLREARLTAQITQGEDNAD